MILLVLVSLVFDNSKLASILIFLSVFNHGFLSGFDVTGC